MSMIKLHFLHVGYIDTVFNFIQIISRKKSYVCKYFNRSGLRHWVWLYVGQERFKGNYNFLIGNIIVGGVFGCSDTMKILKKEDLQLMVPIF